MHFFYLDETGCNGADLNVDQEPIFVLGGIAVKDQGWVATTEAIRDKVATYFAPDPVPEGFELHAHQLLSPNGDGPFAGHDRDRRNQFSLELLDLLRVRGHQVHYVALDKGLIALEATGAEHQTYNTRVPYLLGFDYMTTVINKHVKDRLGHTARGIIILDEKEIFEDRISTITRFRRFEVAKTRRIKWLVEFSYSIDSQKHPMVQLSDLVIYCAKKFLELDRGYRENWPAAAKAFYARCFSALYDRTPQKTFVTQLGQHADLVNELIPKVMVRPRHAWKAHYGIQAE